MTNSSVPTLHVRSQIGLLDPVDIPNLLCFCSVNNTKVSLPKFTFYFVHQMFCIPSVELIGICSGCRRFQPLCFSLDSDFHRDCCGMCQFVIVKVSLQFHTRYE